ncbi:MAG TPA: serine hydrolase, partial [Egibacteraceae bacterium]|nr:serine hydrolase [Egibacteraceae bacterium]
FETATVEQLLTHTAGLSMIVGTAGTVTIHEGPDALDRRVDELLSRRLAAAPGEGFNYSNAGFMLLAAVTEQVTGRTSRLELRLVGRQKFRSGAVALHYQPSQEGGCR